MTLAEAIEARHSVRKYTERPLDEETTGLLEAKIQDINKAGKLHCQLVKNEPKAFKSFMAYGRFTNVRNYIVMAGKKDRMLECRTGYYGQALVLYAQTLGLNTCWVGLTYRKVSNTFNLEKDEKVVCVIAIGYGETQGANHKTRSIEELGDVSSSSPEWYVRGVKAAQLAPSAVNQQKFRFKCLGTDRQGNGIVKADPGFSFVGYTDIDMGIAECNFSIAAAPVRVIFK